jgi:CRISPR-associated protein Csd1
MLVQALAEYADHYLAEELKDAAWETKPVPWQINISRQGNFLNITERRTIDTSGKKPRQVPMTMRVPRSPVSRVNGEHPLLATDDLAYVLGVGSWTLDKESEREKSEKHHKAFVELIRKVAAETGDDALASCVHFYENAEEVEKARAALDKAKAGELAVLAVGYGEPLVEREVVNAFWNEHYRKEHAAERVKGNTGECIVSGKFGPIVLTHEKIKGLSNLGGQASGVSLMSFDKEAFRSYGWEQNQNSPVSPDRALAYVLALNDLLRSKNRRDRGGIAYLSWLKNPGDLDAQAILERADPAQVARLLDFDPATAQEEDRPDPNRFYMVGVSGNGGRLRVRYWVDRTLAEVKSNLRNWFEQLRIEYPKYDGEEAPPVRFWQLLNALDREGKPEDSIILDLMRRSIEGLPLGYPVLTQMLVRLRHPGGSNNAKKAAGKKDDPRSLSNLRVPISLIRICLNDLLRQKKGVHEMSEGLDPNCAIPAYVCGRLMAEFENLQRASSGGEVNSSIVDRYFALASAYPVVAFPKIEVLAQKHLRKLRRDNRAAAVAIDARLQELHELLAPSADGAYPGKLSLEGQGLFALGYYHQKARSRAEAADKQAQKAADAAKNESTEEDN